MWATLIKSGVTIEELLTDDRPGPSGLDCSNNYHFTGHRSWICFPKTLNRRLSSPAPTIQRAKIRNPFDRTVCFPRPRKKGCHLLPVNLSFTANSGTSLGLPLLYLLISLKCLPCIIVSCSGLLEIRWPFLSAAGAFSLLTHWNRAGTSVALFELVPHKKNHSQTIIE